MSDLAPEQSLGSDIASGLYSADSTESTYTRLLELAQNILAAEYGVIVDATFLKRGQRNRFLNLAAQAGVPFLIVDFTAPEETLRARIRARSEMGGDASDADLAVLEYQLRTQEPLQPEESRQTIIHDANAALENAKSAGNWGELFRRLSLDPAAPDATHI